MRCLAPILVKVPRLSKGCRQFVKVPCGKCYNCLVNERSQWAFRLFNQAENSTSNFFITLTYDNDHLPITTVNNKIYFILQKSFMQRWLKNLVQYLRKYYNVVVKYYLVGEYGWKNGRPHYHLHLFDFPEDLDLYEFLKIRWSFGGFFIGSTSGASAMYTTKHNIVKQLDSSLNPNYEVEKISPPFRLVSKGIGKHFKDSLVNCDSNGVTYFHNINYVSLDGNRIPCPRYYKFNSLDGYLKFIQQSKDDYREYFASFADSFDSLEHVALTNFFHFDEQMSYQDYKDYISKLHRDYSKHFFNVKKYTVNKIIETFKINQKL